MILQLEGTKRWHLYAPPEEKSLPVERSEELGKWSDAAAASPAPEPALQRPAGHGAQTQTGENAGRAGALPAAQRSATRADSGGGDAV